jgi:hypothetical protein
MWKTNSILQSSWLQMILMLLKTPLLRCVEFMSKTQSGSRASKTFETAFSKEFRKDPPMSLPLPSSVSLMVHQTKSNGPSSIRLWFIFSRNFNLSRLPNVKIVGMCRAVSAVSQRSMHRDVDAAASGLLGPFETLLKNLARASKPSLRISFRY